VVSITEMAKWCVPRARGDAHLAGVGELDGVTNEVEQNLREALLVAGRIRSCSGELAGFDLGDVEHRIDRRVV